MVIITKLHMYIDMISDRQKKINKSFEFILAVLKTDYWFAVLQCSRDIVSMRHYSLWEEVWAKFKLAPLMRPYDGAAMFLVTTVEFLVT